MAGRLGLVGRLVAILLVALVGIGLAGIGLEWAARGRDTAGGASVPLPDQIAAIVELLERGGTIRRDLVLRAANSDRLRVRVDAVKPADAAGRRLPVAEWLVGHYLEALPKRAIEVRISAEPGASGLARFIGYGQPQFASPLQIVVPLSGGEFATFQTRGVPILRLFGLPTGFWIGGLGAVLGAIAIWAIVREAAPLRDLSRAVGLFSRNARPETVQPRGAPDVQKLIVAVNAMQERIAALLHGRTILLGAVSHDLKTYITRLRLRIEELPDEVQRGKATRDLDEMTELIDSGIAVARAGASVTLAERVDVGAMIADELAARDPARLANRLPAAPVWVTGDAVGLRRVFANLIDNALRFGGHCEVTVARVGPQIEILIDDDGPGIPVAERALVFEPFYRSEGSRSRDTGGSGLGLAIVRQMVEAHGGTVEVLDAPTGGARLKVLLPAVELATGGRPIAVSAGSV